MPHSYNGYYICLPCRRCRFDSGMWLHLKVQKERLFLLFLSSFIFYLNLNNSCNNTNKNIHMKKGTLTHMISVIMNQCTFCMSTPFGCCFLGVVPV